MWTWLLLFTRGLITTHWEKEMESVCGRENLMNQMDMHVDGGWRMEDCELYSIFKIYSIKAQNFVI